MKRTLLFAATLTLMSGAAFAINKIENVRVEPASIKAGASVTITVNGDETQGNNCGLRINYGDGSGLDVKVVDKEQFPRTFTKTYASPGTYTVSVEGKKVTTHFGCMGGARATLIVEAAAPAASPAPAPAATAPPPAPAAPAAKAGAKPIGNCPAGYQASYVAADGSFACKPPVGAVASAPNLVCPAGYAGTRVADGSVQCKPIPKPAPKPKTQCPPDLIYFENPDGAFGCRKPAGK
jgi:hypothetical protein